MSKTDSRRFPVTVTHLPLIRCQICRRTVAYRPGTLSQTLTEHYRRATQKRSAARPGNPLRGTSTIKAPRRPGLPSPRGRVPENPVQRDGKAQTARCASRHRPRPTSS